MNIALLGYGKMGKNIERVALQRGHNIVCKVTETPKRANLSKADVAIDFSVPKAAFNNIKIALEMGIPIVSGTTGWLDDYPKVIELCKKENGSFLYSSNFSLGVNLFFELTSCLAKLLSSYPAYKTNITEIHHTQKLDKPSGTAITLADEILKYNSYQGWELSDNETKKIMPDYLPITALREKDVTGTHIVSYSSDIDNISIKHEAYSREGFALGAVVAAEFLKDKKGIYTMKDVLNFN